MEGHIDLFFGEPIRDIFSPKKALYYVAIVFEIRSFLLPYKELKTTASVLFVNPPASQNTNQSI